MTTTPKPHWHDTYTTVTFVVRLPRQAIVADPLDEIHNDDVMFWGSEFGISPQAIELGADPDLWDKEPMDNTLYEKCAHCHLFIESNGEIPATEADRGGIAEYVHLTRGDAADNAIEETHDATPSGMRATLAVWKAFGPLAMRQRFDDYVPQDDTPLPKGVMACEECGQPIDRSVDDSLISTQHEPTCSLRPNNVTH